MAYYTPPVLYARDVVAWSDEQLDRHLEATCLPCGTRLFSVKDPQNLPPSFIQRLRARVHADAVTSSSADTGPVSLSSLSTSGTLPPNTAEEQYLEDLGQERQFYYLLIDEGGRPWYPIHLLDEVSKNPQDYPEILSYWQAISDNWLVFGSQLQRWREFRDWQRLYREDGRFPKYTLAMKERLDWHGVSRTIHLEVDTTQQDKLTTWIEYLNYEHWWRDQCAHAVKRDQERYDIARRKLIDSGVLRPSETPESVMTFENGFLRKHEKDEAEKVVAEAESEVKAALISIHKEKYGSRGPASTLEQLELVLTAAQSRRDKTVELLERIQRRTAMISEFAKETNTYRSSKKDTAHKDVLVQWIMEQIPLIEAELIGAQSAEGTLGPGGGSLTLQDGGLGTANNRVLDDDERLVDEDLRSLPRSRAASAIPGVGRKSRPLNMEDDEPPRRLDKQSSDSAAVAAGSQHGAHPEKSGSADGKHDEGEKAPFGRTTNEPAKPGRPSPRKSSRAAKRPPTITAPVRSSARLAARRDRLKNAAAPLGATEGQRRRPQRKPAKASGRTAGRGRRGVASTGGALL